MAELEPYRITWKDSGEIVIKTADIAQAIVEFNRMAMDGEIESHPILVNITPDNTTRARRAEEARREYISLFFDAGDVIPHNEREKDFWVWFSEEGWPMIDSVRDADPKKLSPEVVESFTSMLENDLRKLEEVRNSNLKGLARSTCYNRHTHDLMNSMQSTLSFLYRIVEEE